MGDQALAAQGVTEELLARQWEATLAAPRPVGSAALVALHANTIAGFALAGPDEAGAQPVDSAPDEQGTRDRHPGVRAGRGPHFRRAGHASRLLAAIADLTSGALHVWIGADDEERQRFYTSAGFAPSGAVRSMGEQTQHMWWAGRD